MEALLTTITMTEREKRTLDYLLSADFSPLDGHSYGELLGLLKQYKQFYHIIYDDKREMLRKNQFYVKQLDAMEEKILQLEKIIEKKDIQIRNLKEEITRRLTWKERLFGKIILKL